MALRQLRPTLALIALGAVALLAVLPGCGGEGAGEPSPPVESLAEASERAGVEWYLPPEEIPGVRQRLVGSGPDAAVLLWREGERPPREAIVYLHSWLPLPPSAELRQERRYLRRGRSIVYPVYQDPDTPAGQVRRHAVAGIAAGLEAIGADPRTLVAIGATSGGALAFDYAALAPRLGLPRPRAVIGVHPGRNPDGVIPPTDLSRIPPGTRLMAITSEDTRIPDGEAQARALLGGATRVPRRNRTLLRATISGGKRSTDSTRNGDRIRLAIDYFIGKISR